MYNFSNVSRKLFKAEYLLLVIFVTLIASFLSLSLAFSLKLSKLSPKVALAEDAGPDIACIAPKVADYMAKVIEGAGGLTHIKLLSPTFNMTSRYTDELVTKMNDYATTNNKKSFNDLFGISGNAYNAFGKTITEHVNAAMQNPNLSGKSLLLAETGNFDISSKPILRSELGKIQRGEGQDYLGGLLFNAFDLNSRYGHGVLTDSEIIDVCGGDRNCGIIGVNFAVPYDQVKAEHYGRAQNRGMHFTLAIATGGASGVSATVSGANDALSRGITPVIRIGTKTGGSGGFDDAATYVNFLKSVDSQISGTAYAIAGPNEPESETWAAPNCKAETIVGEPWEVKYTPCNDIRDPEFHTLRPYPASPCKEPPGSLPTEPQALMCGNDLLFKETFVVGRSEGDCGGPSGGQITCKFNINSDVNVSVDLSKAELPIAGNTEDVPNSTTNVNNIENVERINQYVSWYLNGTPTSAEEEDRTGAYNNKTSEVDNRLINFSGPIRKLMPWSIQAVKRIETIQEGFDSRNSGAEVRHDQIVGCRIIDFIKGDLPTPCYHQTALTLYAMRLTEWLSPINRLFPPDLYLTGGFFTTENLLPPLEKNFPILQDYIKAYRTWMDNVACTPSVAGLFTCSPKIKSPWWSNLFSAIPFSTTEDKKGPVEFFADEFKDGQQPSIVLQPQSSEVKIKSLTFNPTKTTKYLYFPHMAENSELGEFLQKTYIPQGESGYSGKTGDDGGPHYPTNRCEVLETRTNPGDDLYGEYDEDNANTDNTNLIRGTLNYTGEFTCKFPDPGPCVASCRTIPIDQRDHINSCLAACDPKCTKEVTVAAGSVYTHLPKGEEVWERFVNGTFSVFKRIFPKVGQDTPVDNIKDIPAVTSASYSASGGSGVGLTTIAGSESKARPGSDAQLYFKHLGSVHEYFLNGIQKALRPQGFSEGPLSGQPGTPGTPGKPTDGTGSCTTEFLSPIWASEASSASCICQKESGGNPNAFNDGCLRVGDTYDYSIGLFQINLLAHCPDAFSSKGSTDSDYRVTVPCVPKTDGSLEACVNKYKDGKNNATKAKELKDARGNWGDWYTNAGICGLPR